MNKIGTSLSGFDTSRSGNAAFWKITTSSIEGSSSHHDLGGNCLHRGLGLKRRYRFEHLGLFRQGEVDRGTDVLGQESNVWLDRAHSFCRRQGGLEWAPGLEAAFQGPTTRSR